MNENKRRFQKLIVLSKLKITKIKIYFMCMTGQDKWINNININQINKSVKLFICLDLVQ